MVGLYFRGHASEKGEAYLSLCRVPFRCGKEYAFHAVTPKNQRTPVQTIEYFAMQQGSQFFKLPFGIEGDAAVPVEELVPFLRVGNLLYQVFCPLFHGIAFVQWIRLVEGP